MPNKSYQRGRAFEYRTKYKLEKEGYIVVRSAGSHTKIDICAFRRNETLLIQCKNMDYVRQNDINEARELANQIGQKIEIWHKKGKIAIMPTFSFSLFQDKADTTDNLSVASVE